MPAASDPPTTITSSSKIMSCWLALQSLKCAYCVISVSAYVAVGAVVVMAAIVLTVLLMVVVYRICKKKKTTTSHNGPITGKRTMCVYSSWTMNWLFFFFQGVDFQDDVQVMYYLHYMCLFFLSFNCD